MGDKQVYSEEIHAENLILMLESVKRLCNLCPKHSDMIRGDGIEPDHWDHFKVNPCDICQQFLDLDCIDENSARYQCPCHRLGSVEARELTEEKLTEKGYWNR